MIKFGKDVRDELLSGSNQLARAVKATLGARGKNFAFLDHMGNPTVTKDGVTVANSITLGEPFAEMGARLIKEATRKVSKDGGDGTTTATTIADYIITNGMAAAEKYNPIFVKRGMDLASTFVIKEIDKNSKKISTEKEVKQVASISANNDGVIGSIISESLKKAGKNGLVTVKLGNAESDTIELTDGIEIAAGYADPLMITDVRTQIATLENPCVLLYDGRIDTFRQINGIVNQAIEAGKPLVIIANRIEGQALSTLALNHNNGVLDVVAIDAPGSGENQKDIIKDLAIVLGAKVFESSIAHHIESAMLIDLGNCSQIKVSNMYTEIISDPEIAHHEETKKALGERIDMLKNLIDENEDEYTKHIYRSRLAKLDGKIAVIGIGGSSDIDRQERGARMTDSLHAARAAIADGIVEGGGVALIKASAKLDEYIKTLDVAKDIRTGMEIVSKSVLEPFITILENAEMKKQKKYIKSIRAGKIGGIDVNKLEAVECMYGAGIIDPLKVTKTAVSQAISIASTIITVEGAYHALAR